ncbi:MAG: hypothetical protein LBN27_12410 [Prevotellaceae bacterium]|jgi:hypothetical protein|nr:hypothetical protein [Prevotellaceae bacterium]
MKSKRLFIFIILSSSILYVYPKKFALHEDSEDVAWSPFSQTPPVDYPVDFGLIGLDYDPFLPIEVRDLPPGFEEEDCLGCEVPVGAEIPAMSLFAGFYAFFVVLKKRKQKNLNL